MTSPLPAQPSTLDAQDGGNATRKTSPTGMADSIASLPAISSKSVPATPFGFSGMGPNGGGPRTRTPNTQDGLTQAQRGYSNPDLAKTFGKSGGFSALDNGAPRVCRTTEFLSRPCASAYPIQPYNPDPMYGMYSPNGAPLPPTAAVAAAFTPGAFDQPGGFDPYGFDDDGYGSGALYPGGSVGLKNKRAEADRECKFLASHPLETCVRMLTHSQPIHRCPNRGSTGRTPQPLQGSTRMSIPPKEA